MRFLVFGRDPGGANALLPVVRALTARSGDSVDLLAQAWAEDVFRCGGAPFRAAGPDDFPPALARTDAALTGTSWPPDAETRLWRAAEEAGVPTLALFDYWANYRVRFLGPSGEPVWPTRIAVMDAAVAREMEAEGAPKDRIVVTGQPFLEMRAAQLRAKAGAAPPPRKGRVLFVSQPLSASPSAGERGYDEFSALRLAADAVERAARTSGRPLCLALKPHPKENPAGLRAALGSPPPGVTHEWEEDGDAALLKSEVVLGMSSMMLVEAALAGCPIVSVQPGLPRQDEFYLSRTGRCPRAGTVEDVERFLAAALRAGPASGIDGFSRDHDGAAGRVTDLLRGIAGRPRAFGGKPKEPAP